MLLYPQQIIKHTTRIAALLCLICLQPYEVSAHVAKPTVINATGEYYIVNRTTDFSNQEIQCNSSISNCFVICRGSYDNGCQQSHIMAPNNANSSLYIQCDGDYACEDARIIGSKNHNSLLSLECSSYGCPGVYVNTMHSNQSSITCHWDQSCRFLAINSTANRNKISYLSINLHGNSNILSINTSNVTMLTLTMDDRLNQVLLYQSLWTNHTTIICDKVDSCLDSVIAIPPSSGYHFNANVVVNGQNIDTFGYMYLTIYCMNTTGNIGRYDQWDPIYCTNRTDFPIFDVAVPSKSRGNSVYYISEDEYWYRYQSIILDEKAPNINDYHIECKHDHSCSLTFIEFTANVDSNCRISCTGYYSCSKYTIYSMPTNNSNISMACQGDHVCTGLYYPVDQWTQSSIIALSGNELTFVLDDYDHDHFVNISGSDGQSMYIYLKSVYGNVIYINGTNAKVLDIKLDERRSSGNWNVNIHGPISQQSIFNLMCVNYGCYLLGLWLPNGTGLDHVNVSFAGDCEQCHLELNADDGSWIDVNYTNCIRGWALYCPNQAQSDYVHSDFHHFMCSDKDNHQCKLCSDDTAKNIQNAFTEYWVGFECPPDKTLFIVLISGGSALFLLLVLMIVRYKYRKKKHQGAATEYHPIETVTVPLKWKVIIIMCFGVWCIGLLGLAIWMIFYY